MMRFNNTTSVSEITAAVFVPIGGGTPIHRDRPYDGIAFNQASRTVYRFDTGLELICGSGQCIYLPKSSSYQCEALSEGEPTSESGVYCINFIFGGIEERDAPFVLTVKAADEIRSAYERAEHLWTAKTVGYYEECMISLYRIIKLLKQQMSEYTPKGRLEPKIASAIEYIEHNFTSELSVPMLAELCGVSETYLRRVFVKIYGVPPSLYLRNRRIEYAKELLRTNEYTVTEVASRSGFGDPSYFSREFRKAVGVSPKDYINKEHI